MGLPFVILDKVKLWAQGGAGAKVQGSELYLLPPSESLYWLISLFHERSIPYVSNCLFSVALQTFWLRSEQINEWLSEGELKRITVLLHHNTLYWLKLKGTLIFSLRPPHSKSIIYMLPNIHPVTPLITVTIRVVLHIKSSVVRTKRKEAGLNWRNRN